MCVTYTHDMGDNNNHPFVKHYVWFTRYEEPAADIDHHHHYQYTIEQKENINQPKEETESIIKEDNTINTK